MNEQRTYILAGTYQQAVDAARLLPRDQWRYVDEDRHLYGVHAGSLLVVGTFWERRDAARLYDLARANGLEEPTHD